MQKMLVVVHRCTDKVHATVCHERIIENIFCCNFYSRGREVGRTEGGKFNNILVVGDHRQDDRDGLGLVTGYMDI